MGKAGRISTSTTQPDSFLTVYHCEKTTVFTGIAGELIRAFHQTLLREFSHTMSNNTISLHFSEAQTRFYLAPQGICSLFPRYAWHYPHTPSRAGLDSILSHPNSEEFQ